MRIKENKVDCNFKNQTYLFLVDDFRTSLILRVVLIYTPYRMCDENMFNVYCSYTLCGVSCYHHGTYM